MECNKKFYLEAPVKVHTYDTDYMGIVSNTVYPKYFEDLRNAILDKYFPLEDMMKEHNTPILSETHIKYIRERSTSRWWVPADGRPTLRFPTRTGCTAPGTRSATTST